jgi:hypothetical protein
LQLTSHMSFHADVADSTVSAAMSVICARGRQVIYCSVPTSLTPPSITLQFGSTMQVPFPVGDVTDSYAWEMKCVRSHRVSFSNIIDPTQIRTAFSIGKSCSTPCRRRRLDRRICRRLEMGVSRKIRDGVVSSADVADSTPVHTANSATARLPPIMCAVSQSLRSATYVSETSRPIFVVELQPTSNTLFSPADVGDAVDKNDVSKAVEAWFQEVQRLTRRLERPHEN